MAESDFLTVAELAAYLGKPRPYVDRLRHERHPLGRAGRKVGRYVLFPVREVARYFDLPVGDVREWLRRHRAERRCDLYGRATGRKSASPLAERPHNDEGGRHPGGEEQNVERSDIRHGVQPTPTPPSRRPHA